MFKGYDCFSVFRITLLIERQWRFLVRPLKKSGLNVGRRCDTLLGILGHHFADKSDETRRHGGIKLWNCWRLLVTMAMDLFVRGASCEGWPTR